MKRMLIVILRHDHVLFVILVIANFLCKIASSGWIDPDTKKNYYKTNPLTVGDDRSYELVFSDEFEVEGRTFKDGDDPRWTALDKNDYTNDALHYYSSKNVKTTNGVLNISTTFHTNKYVAINEETKKSFTDEKFLQSAMVQGWNKFCFTGGIIEISAKLPGNPRIGGLWPALWLLGNLARGTYVGSSDYIWPWSFNTCDETQRTSQEINACASQNHFGLHSFQGRGSPEIDIMEGMSGESGPLPNTKIERPYFSTSLQVAPGVRNYRPQLGKLPREGFWYDGLEYGNVTDSDLNPFFYGVTLVHKPKSYTYQSDALSANTRLNETHFQNQHLYRVEWEPPDEKGENGYIRWYFDSQLVYGITSDVLKLSQTLIPSEPMYILLNTAVSTSWGFPMPCPEGCDCDCYECGNPDCSCGFPEGFCDVNVPSFFEIDYVRVYQATNNDSKHELGCSTEKRPTELFIKGHEKRYMTTSWNGIGEQKQPLKHILNGTGICSLHSDCGAGSCVNRRCHCKKGFVGPHCLASEAFNDYAYHRPIPDIHATNIFFPKSIIFFAILFSFSFILVLFNVASQHYKETITLTTSYTMASPSNYLREYMDEKRRTQKQDDYLMQQFERPSKTYVTTLDQFHQNRDSANQSLQYQPTMQPLIHPNNSYNSLDRMDHLGTGETYDENDSLSSVSRYNNMEQQNNNGEHETQNTNVISYCVIDGRLLDN